MRPLDVILIFYFMSGVVFFLGLALMHILIWTKYKSIK